MKHRARRWLAACALALAAFGLHAASPQVVHFMSRDGKTLLTGYVYLPAAPGPHRAVVLLHGRSGLYSTLSGGVYTAATLTLRHKMWGRFWAAHGYVGLLVDSFGPRGYPAGFPKHSYSERPPAVSEQHVRPLDAYGALDYLRSRRDVRADAVGLQGWSNGGMTVLAAVAPHPPGLAHPSAATGFAAAIAEYPSCRQPAKQTDYVLYLPLLILSGTQDDEVSPWVCRRFVRAVAARGGRVQQVLYAGANHAYDDPGATKQSRLPNREALRDTQRRALDFFREHLR